MEFTSKNIRCNSGKFYCLPLRFEQNRLQQELSQFREADWEPDVTSADGDATIIMVSVGGTSNYDLALSGQVAPTASLGRCPYFQQVLASFQTPVSRCRLTRLRGATKTPVQTNRNYHWYRRASIYIPILTNQSTELFCCDKSIRMTAGDAWTLDHTLPHWMINKSSQDCVHLVVEIKGFPASEETSSQNIPYMPDHRAEIDLEPYFFEVLMPQEIDVLSTDLLSEIGDRVISHDDFAAIERIIAGFREQWKTAFTRFGHHSTGELTYQDLILHFNEEIVPGTKKWLSPTGKGKYAIDVIRSMLLMTPPPPKRISRHLVAKRKIKAKIGSGENAYHQDGMDGHESRLPFQGPVFNRPIFIVSAPRAGSTLLFNTLSHFPALWTIGEESHELIEGIEGLHPSTHDFHSNRLTEADATPPVSVALRERFVRELQDREGRAYLGIPMEQLPGEIRFLEKTPKNALRIPFLKAVFPDALFIHLYRDPEENISSIMEGWRSRRFVAYRDLPGWPFREWSFLLVPGWSSLRDCSLAEIAAYQWKAANACISEDLQALPESDRCFIRYSDLIGKPKETMEKISEFAGLDWDPRIEQVVSKSLPVSQMTLSAPSPDKWRRNEEEILAALSHWNDQRYFSG
uniref:Aspartyl/Asparaginyl beta-hydroxylase n=1 Tax=Candidatus Kentrum sp. FW TaxID=2126338 RepID=A0A450S7V1_9GAMM|nr:MAG: Aspartyl/Asparaginyl beta-hydroxylase [Candidatus Kentron sp. FW]